MSPTTTGESMTVAERARRLGPQARVRVTVRPRRSAHGRGSADKTSGVDDVAIDDRNGHEVLTLAEPEDERAGLPDVDVRAICIAAGCTEVFVSARYSEVSRWMDAHAAGTAHDPRWPVTFQLQFGSGLPGVEYRSSVADPAAAVVA
ncbi:hypothetical protein [Cellulomonas triticagri]|uniref:hypothetical protein n=1 Tax=Cellulomonas triticagri TaxID=2483352 RepID=UPI00131571AD|nr:hypothetical protein [Cellulomonas triticagri]